MSPNKNSEQSCGIVVVYRGKDGDRFLLVHQMTGGKWSFPKGHVEPGETPEVAARRELFEECAITEVALVPDIYFSEMYEIDRAGVPTQKSNMFFLGFVNGLAATPQAGEIFECRFVTYEEALELFSYKDSRRILTEAKAVLDNLSAA